MIVEQINAEIGNHRSDPSKSMAAYERSCSMDAVEMARRMIRSFDLIDAKEQFESMTVARLTTAEKKWEKEIADFLQTTETFRPRLLRQFEDAHGKPAVMLLFTLCIISAQRVAKMIALREKYRNVLAPGISTRATNAGMYEFSKEMRRLEVYAWPEQVFRLARRSD